MMTILYSNFPAMKKNVLFIAAFCAAALVSCTPKELVIEEPKTIDNPKETTELIYITIKASMSESTKATISTDRTWTWEKDDELAVFDGTTVTKKFGIKEILSDGQAIFDGYVASTEGLKAVFPYSAALSDGSYKLSSSQTISTEQTVDPAAMVATATGEKASGTDFTFYFTPAVSFFKLTVDAGVDKVVLHCVKKEDTIAGDSRSLSVTVPGKGTYWVPVNPLSYTGIRAFAKSGDVWTLKAADSTPINLSKPGSGKNLGTVSGGAEVSVIENADNLISYLGNPTLDGYIVNDLDLDLTDETITNCATFAETFDGQCHSIKNWTSNGVALFGKNTGTIKNITIDKSCKLSLPEELNGRFGFIVCETSGNVSGLVNNAGLKSTSKITGAARIGMLIGFSDEAVTISQCENYGNMQITLTDGNTTSMFGGVMGQIGNENASIEDCKNAGSIQVKLDVAWESKCNLYVGGVTGQSSSKASSIRLRNEKDVQLSAPSGILQGVCVGGCTSYATGTISECFNSGDVSFVSGAGARATLVGGITGYMAGAGKILSDCRNEGHISFEAAYQAGYNNIGDIKYDVDKTTNKPLDSNTAVYKCGAIVGGLVAATAVKTLKFNSSENYGEVSVKYTDPMNTKHSINTAGRVLAGGCIGDCWGTVNGLKNYGKVNVSLTAGDLGDQTFTANNAGYTTYVGGIVGAGYLNKDQNVMSLTGCENHGIVSVHSLNTQASYTNHAIGGIVGWPGKESGNANAITSCINGSDAAVIVSGTINARVGGISGGSVGVSSCYNRGTVKLQGDSLFPTCSLGGIVGFQGQTYIMQNCESTGPVESETAISSAVVNDKTNFGGVGGLIGVLGNATNSSRYGGVVNCHITVPASVDEVGMLVGHYNGTGACPIGSEDHKVSVGGAITKGAVTTNMTQETMTREYMFGAHSNANNQQYFVQFLSL